MPAYSVRGIIRWSKREDQAKRHVYEERITAWNAPSLDEAIELAEADAKRYADQEGFEALDLFQGYWLFDSIERIDDGTEVFSLLRESDLDSAEYLDAFFDTGNEREGTYGQSEEAEQASDGDA